MKAWNKKIRFMTYISMIILLPLLMAYSLIGEEFHEAAGTAILMLFIVHHALNGKWHGALFKGKYNVGRIFQVVMGLLLAVFAIFQSASGVLMSKHLYTFIPVLPILSQVRNLHMLLAYWGYVLLCVHVGVHLTRLMRKLFARSKKVFAAVCAACGGIAIYGGKAFMQRGFTGYLSGRMSFAIFDHSEPRLYFFLDYLVIMLLFMMAGCLITYGIGRIKGIPRGTN